MENYSEEIDWKKHLEKYQISTVLKENLLKPYFENLKLEEPILDIGCGNGYFSELFSNQKLHITGIDPNIELKNNDYFKFVKNDISKFDTKERFKTILLINVLSVLSKEKRLQVIKKILELKSPTGKIYLITMNSDLYKNDFQSDELSIKKINSEVVELKFKLIDGSHITFNDNIILDDEINSLIKEVNLKIDEIKEFKYNNIKEPIYKLFIIK